MSATVQFFEIDFAATLFPLKTNLLVVQNHGAELSDHIYQRILNPNHPEDSFLPQQRVYATKPRGHLRRTSKLDPIAEYFLYDIVYRNRGIFRPEVSDARRSFGYRFKEGVRIPVHVAYSVYKQVLGECAKQFKHNIQFDVASYFNSLYHHDVAHWFEGQENVTDLDGRALNQFFREINSGRSIDFMPHGIYPAKMLGNEFLKFVDLHGPLKSTKIVRFMDDIKLFDDDLGVLNADFTKIQQLLGQFALNINPSKTGFDNSVGDVTQTLSAFQQSLKEIITEYVEVPSASGIGLVETGIEIENKLDDGQVDALLSLLKNEDLEESDADLILGFLKAHSNSLLEQLPALVRRFPNLIKHIHTVCAGVTEKAELSSIILEYLNEDSDFLEYQLFWVGAIVEDYLIGEDSYGDVLLRLFELTADCKIARAKVLEIPEQGFGLKEIRSEYLKTGQSDWLSWSSAAGSRTLKAAERNYILSYFGKASAINNLVAESIKKIA